MKISTIGIDLAKEVFQVHGVDKHCIVVLRKKLRRSEMVEFFAKLEPCLVGMEGCGGAHSSSRQLIGLGHSVNLMAPQFVKPYVKSDKNVMVVAEAICEVVSRLNMRFVQIKTSNSNPYSQFIVPVKDSWKPPQCRPSSHVVCEFGIVLPQGIITLTKRPPPNFRRR